MAGGIAEAYYKNIPKEICDKVMEIISKDVNFLSIIKQFNKIIIEK
jgi:hypothetical protein